MDKKQRDKNSRFLSLVLRHKPEEIDLVLDDEGWANTNEILKKLKISLEDLQEIVELNDKQRFILSDDLLKIRANQGHSIKADLKLAPTTPPEILYHGTAEKNIDSFFSKGILKGQRNHVHLSENTDTARKVGKRYGKPVLIEVSALEMYNAGFEFFISVNNVWLTDEVPVQFLKINN